MYVGEAKKRIRMIKEKNTKIPNNVLIQAGGTTINWFNNLYTKSDSDFIAAKIIYQMEENASSHFEVWKISQEVEQEERVKEEKYWEKVLDWTCSKCKTRNEGTQFCSFCGLDFRDFYFRM